MVSAWESTVGRKKYGCLCTKTGATAEKLLAKLAIDRNKARQPQTDAADGKTDYGLHINTVEKRVGFSKN
jgi:hypothetical protein